MNRLQQYKNYIDWLEPLHEIVMEETGLSDFGEPHYRKGLEVVLAALDVECDLNEIGKLGTPMKLVHVLKQRLLAEQAFKAKPEILNNKIVKPVVITGIVRTGSTALHYLMAKDPNRQHLEYWLGENPQPRPPRNVWDEEPGFQSSKDNIDMMYGVSPELKAIHFMAPDWPEECGHLMAHTFTDDFWQCGRKATHYNDWYETTDLVPAYTQHKKLLQLIGSNEPDKPWLLKYPVHMKHLKSFLSVYPDAQVIWTHRDPSKIMTSYVSLIAGFRGISVNPESINRDDILREQMEIWAAGAERAMAVRKQFPQAQFYDMYFEDFMADSVAEVKKAYDQFSIDWTPECEAALKGWHDDNPQNKHGKHEHSIDDITVSRDEILERFSKYINHFNVHIKK